MSYKDAIARAKKNRPEPIVQGFMLGDELYHVPIRRLDGPAWAMITSECPPETETDARLGYNTRKAALIACQRHSQLLDAEQKPVDPEVVDGQVVAVDWAMIFDEISGVELNAISATWWALNQSDPNERVVAAKKASRAGSETSSN